MNGFYSEGSRELCRGAYAAGEGPAAAACVGGCAAGRPNGWEGTKATGLGVCLGQEGERSSDRRGFLEKILWGSSWLGRGQVGTR